MNNGDRFRLWVGKYSDTGQQRDHNEDAFGMLVPNDPAQMRQRGSLFAVADGMGGHAAGEVASQSAIETLLDVYSTIVTETLADSLREAVNSANDRVVAEARKRPERHGMGTTLVAVVIRGGQAVIANVGDCRLYLLRNGVLSQLTNDHSFVAEQVRAGLITEEEARTHPRRNIILRALGTAEANPDISETTLIADDILILCSDGLYGVIGNEAITRLAANPDPNAAARSMVDLANQNGGPDNITAVVIRVEEFAIDPNAVTQQLPHFRSNAKAE